MAVSVPSPPFRMSSPLFPCRVSFPSLPLNTLFPLFPLIVFAKSLPFPSISLEVKRVRFSTLSGVVKVI